jgi:hypothetical protein
MSPKLSICVVTECRQRINAFLSAQQQIFSQPGVELLIFCPNDIIIDIQKQLAGIPHCQVLSDEIKSGPSRKRNLLFDRARGEFVAFLDDDSLFVEPARAVANLLARMEAPADWLLWTARYRHMDGRAFDVQPKPFSCFGAGSGIEWNQAVRRDVLLKARAWHPDFCTGAKWRSGGALKLMIRLRALGFRQTLVPQVVIEHPAQLEETDPASVDKMLRYRYGLGAVVASESSRLGWFRVLLWIVRLGLLAPLRGVVDLARGHKASGFLRVGTPVRAFQGAADWIRDQQLKSCAQVPTP